MVIKTFGTSMLPILRSGDILYIQKKPFSQIKVNDFVTFKNKGVFITHRVIYRDPPGRYILTKGDNNPAPDRKIHPKDILGVVKKIKRDRLILNSSDLYLFQSTFYYKEIASFKNELKAKSIDFVILKGLPLHLYFEKTYPRRIYVDCDILIDEKDYLKTKKILAQNGYKKAEDSLSFIDKRITDKVSEVSFYKYIGGFKVVFDIHLEAVFLMTQLGSLNSLYSDKLIKEFTHKLLSEKKVIKLNNEEFPILSIENLIIYLALHIFHHNFKGYYRYQLLHLIISSTNPDYNKILYSMNKFKIVNFVYPVFLLLKKFYSTPLKSGFFQKATPASKLNEVKTIVHKEKIFEDETRISSGTKRFKYIYLLSPYPSVKKITVFFNPQVFNSILWILKRNLKRLYFGNYFFLK